MPRSTSSSSTPASSAGSTGSMQLNMREHVRNAVVHVFHWMAGLLRTELPDDFVMVKGIMASQLLSNAITWLTASKVALAATLRFYTPVGRQVNMECLPIMLTLIYLSAHETGKPSWKLAALEAQDTVRKVRHNLEQTPTDATWKTLRTRRASQAAKVFEGLYALQKIAVDTVAEPFFRDIDVHELPFMGDLRAFTAAAATTLLLENRDNADDFFKTMERLALECDTHPPTVVENVADAMLASMHETVAAMEKQIVFQISSVETALMTRMCAIHDDAKDAKARACGVEQVVDDKLAGMLAKVAALTKRLDTVERNVEADTKKTKTVKTLEDRMSALEIVTARDLKAVDSRINDLYDNQRQRATVWTPPSSPPQPCLLLASPPRLPPPPPPSPAKEDMDRLWSYAEAVRAVANEAKNDNDALRATVSRLEAQVQWLVQQSHVQMCSTWNAVHAQWHAMVQQPCPDVAMPVIALATVSPQPSQ